MRGIDLRSLKFDGAKTLEPQPLKWTVVNDAPGRERATRRCGRGRSSNLDVGGSHSRSPCRLTTRH